MAQRHVQDIEAEKTEYGVKMRHPAFGQISASRVSGQRELYGSDFVHQSYITISISTSELRRDLNRDWPFEREQIVELALSEAQWATFVSAMNVGEGVQCTIVRRHGSGLIPSFPIQDRRKQLKSEFGDKLKIALHKMKALLTTIDEMSIPKSRKDELRGQINSVIMELKHNLPFVAEQFEEHVEETIEKMKSEVHGYIQGVLQRTGLDALKNGQSPLQLKDKSEDAT